MPLTINTIGGNFLNLLKVAVLSFLVFISATLFCVLFFYLTEVVAYRLVVVFLALIFVSNALAKLSLFYVENKN